MAKQLITWQEKVSDTAYDTIYPETLSEQVHINNEIANNLGISPEVSLDTALGKLSTTDKNIRAQGVATGTATALALSVNVFTLFDGVVVRAKIPFDTEKGLTLNVNNTGAKSIYRIDGQPIDLVLKSGAWCTFIYSSALDGWVLQGWSTKPVVKTEVITKTQTWTVPDGVTSVNVLLFGGGGGGGYTSVSHEPTYEETGTGAGGGGGGGYMAKSTLTVTPKQTINITIGAGGVSASADGYNGGVTSFGTLLSAQGGGGGKKGTSTYTSGKGGDGGTGGSGGGGGSASKRRDSESSRYNYVQPGGNGGNGAQFGGGGGAYRGNGGNGGTYGGGGGAGDGGTAGVGGQYGGSGGAPGKAGSAGTNTTSIADIDFKGEGKGGNGYTVGSEKRSGGGGGGYGGNGGNGGSFEGGGGGGYGGKGGNGGENGGGGGGYGAPAYGAGGGGYGINNYGHGGDSDKGGASGICIITYVTQES